jgi:hypothetical protein
VESAFDTKYCFAGEPVWFDVRSGNLEVAY